MFLDKIGYIRPWFCHRPWYSRTCIGPCTLWHCLWNCNWSCRHPPRFWPRRMMMASTGPPTTTPTRHSWERHRGTLRRPCCGCRRKRVVVMVEYFSQDDDACSLIRQTHWRRQPKEARQGQLLQQCWKSTSWQMMGGLVGTCWMLLLLLFGRLESNIRILCEDDVMVGTK